MRNPILEEAGEVFLRRKEYVRVHLVFVAILTAFTVAAWPGQGFMEYFRTETIPMSFQAVAIFRLLISAVFSLYAGLDRLAESQIIKYSEWLERTRLPVRMLATGKLVAATLHALFIEALGFPMVVIAAGPAGVPFRALMACELIVLFTVVVCRFAAMLISHRGETRYFTRVTGGWLFLALLFIATVRISPALNPIMSVLSQYSEDSPLMRPAGSATAVSSPLTAPAIGFTVVAVALASLYVLSLYLHRRNHLREHGSAY
jgi:hypothetical protein